MRLHTLLPLHTGRLGLTQTLTDQASPAVPDPAVASSVPELAKLRAQVDFLKRKLENYIRASGGKGGADKA